MNAYNPFSLEGKNVLITGASSGIGRATAIESSRLGAKVIITGRNEQRLNETFNSLCGEGHQKIMADLNNADDVSNLVKYLPNIDGFVCNAGITKRKPINFIKQEDLFSLFETNVFSCFMLTKAIMKTKKMNQYSSIVFTSSKAAKQVTPGNSIYAASKAAIESFSRSCALEYASKGIRCNAVLPGMVETPLAGSTGMLSKEEIERDKQHYLLKRYGQPKEIAWAIIFLLSDASRWITSSSLIVDGGGQNS